MPVDAIGADIQRAVFEPFDRDIGCVEGGVFDLGERLDPVDALRLAGPEPVRIFDRLCVPFAILVLVDVGALLPMFGNRMNLN
jgi:hypothetical protein